jgi:hypothetical protein
VKAKDRSGLLGALRLGCLASGLLAPSVGWGHSGAGSECAPAPSLRGDPREVQQLSRSLARYQTGEPTHHDCRPWVVTVWRTGPQLLVELTDGAGVTVVRHVSDAEVAAAVVDSWTHRDFVPALALAPIPARPAAEIVAEPAAAAPVAPRARDPLTFTLGPDVAMASDGSRWVGAHAGACVAVGRFCAGAIAQGAAGSAIVGDPGTTRRYTGSLLASLERPVALGPTRFIPGVAVGAGFTQENTSDPPSASNPLEPTGARRNTDWDFLTSARAVLAIPLVGRLGVDVGGALELALPPRAPATDGQGGAYPAEPRFFFRGGVALRYGRP